jgi:hypothetical protein
MKDTYCKRTYKCKCGIVEEFVWESELKTFKFTCKCGKKLGFENIKKVEVPQMASIRTPTKNR